jgi:hypothetical protein
MFGVIEGGSAYHKITATGFESISNRTMDTIGVNGAGSMGRIFFVTEFIPYQYTRHSTYSYEKSNHHHYTTYEVGSRK